jgi:hypothetical protein
MKDTLEIPILSNRNYRSPISENLRLCLTTPEPAFPLSEIDRERTAAGHHGK